MVPVISADRISRRFGDRLAVACWRAGVRWCGGAGLGIPWKHSSWSPLPHQHPQHPRAVLDRGGKL